MNLATLRPLGSSGLLVSPLALGTMTFGTPRWGMDETASRAVFDRYVELGGNFIDTADVYSGGTSEAMVGRFVAEAGLRERMVLATNTCTIAARTEAQTSLIKLSLSSTCGLSRRK